MIKLSVETILAWIQILNTIYERCDILGLSQAELDRITDIVHEMGALLDPDAPI